MNKGITVGIILLLVGMCIVPSTGTTDVKKSIVATLDGNTLYVGGSGPGNYSKIQDAINDSENGDTVFVYNGVYYEALSVDKSINLIGEDKNTTIIDGMKKKSVINVNNIYEGGISICCFTITNCSPIPGLFAGIFLDICDYNKIFDNIFINNQFQGIWIHGSNNNTVFNNNFVNNKLAIEIFNGKDNSIYDNIISENYQAIELFSSTNNSIFCNVIEMNGRSIDLYHSGYNKIFLNLINNNERGMNLLYSSNYLGYTSDNLVFKNIISNTSRYGFRTINASNNFIYHNNFIDNPHGHVTDSSNNTWDNGYPSGGNYWDDYNGTDNNGDGIGDTPYPIPGGDNEDRYPLMYPTCNVPPNKPVIDGPTCGKPGIEYEYTFNSTDLNDDPVMYIIKWGDNDTDWTEYGDSGIEIILKHTWDEKGVYTIKAKAIDIHGAESDWAYLEVTMPKNQNMQYGWLSRFPLLQRILSLQFLNRILLQ